MCLMHSQVASGTEVRGMADTPFDFKHVDSLRTLTAYYFCALGGPMSLLHVSALGLTVESLMRSLWEVTVTASCEYFRRPCVTQHCC